MSATPALQYKHVRIDQVKLDRARRLLAARTETEALDRALSLVVAEGEIDAALIRLKARASSGRSSGDMRRLVVDTSIFIDWLNAGRHGEILAEPQEPASASL